VTDFNAIKTDDTGVVPTKPLKCAFIL
jgi:hypothetical protein